MATNHSSDEITMGKLTQSIRSIYYSFIILLYRFFKFLLRNWIVLIVIIGIGIGLGVWKNSIQNPSREGTLIVQINFKSANQIYQSIEVLNERIKNDEEKFLKKYHFYEDTHLLLKSIEIEPIINLTEVLQYLPENNRSFELLMDETNFKDELLSSEVFLPLYRLHKLKITISHRGDQEEIIKNVLAYLNSEEEINNLKSVFYQNLETKIKEAELTIAGIDSIIKRLGSAHNIGTAGQVYVSSNDNNIESLHLLLQEKDRALIQLEDLKIDQKRNEEIVVSTSEPLFNKKQGLLYNKAIIYPILFLLIFFFISWLRHSFNKAASMLEKQR